MNVHLRLGAHRPVPAHYRAQFRHLYLDIAWFGILSASAISFVGVYCARLGATAAEVGLLTLGPGLANLAFGLPAGRWLEKQPTGTAVFWSGVFHRFFYLLWIPLPMLLAPKAQVWALIGLTLLMHVPGSALTVGFNALFAEAVTPEWRAHVAGMRNAMLALTYIPVSLVCGQILHRLPFPLGYQVVFGLGFVGAVMSTVHLWYLIPCASGPGPGTPGRRLRDLWWPSPRRTVARLLHPGAGGQGRGLLRTEVLKGPFGRLVAVLFAFYLSLYIAIPLFPIHWVNNVGLTDGEIGLGTALFYVATFLGSTRLAGLSRKMGNHRVTALGAVIIASYPAFMAATRGLSLYLIGSVAGGIAWSLLGGAVVNYVLEKVPEHDRAPYLAWYNLAINAALVIGALVGPYVGGQIGIPAALALSAGARLLSAIAIWRWE